MPKIKKVYAENFTIFANQVFEDENLTLKAKGLFGYMWTKSDDWNFYITELVKHSKCGRDQVMSALDELERNGYLLRSRNRNSLGQLTNKSTWLLSDTPKKHWIEQKNKKVKKAKAKKAVNKSVDNSTKPKSENPTLEKPTLENPTLPSTDITKYLNNQVLSLSLSKSLPKRNQRLVSKRPAIDQERDEKINQIIFYFNTQRGEWHMDMKPVSDRERTQLARVIGNHRFEDIKPLIKTAVANAESYPMGYLISMIKNLPEAGHAERIR